MPGAGDEWLEGRRGPRGGTGEKVAGGRQQNSGSKGPWDKRPPKPNMTNEAGMSFRISRIIALRSLFPFGESEFPSRRSITARHPKSHAASIWKCTKEAEYEFPNRESKFALNPKSKIQNQAVGFSGRSSGNKMTSRMDRELVSSMARRSMPMPSPPVGGMP